MPRKKAKAPFLGKLKLYWCEEDNLPILDAPTCPLCKNPTIKIKLTPPGDVRPAFDNDMKRIRETIDNSYGNGLGNLVFPENNIYLINRTPGIDFSVEILSNGFIYGRFMYNLLNERFEFHPREVGAQLLVYYAHLNNIELKKTINMYEDSVPFIQEGKSILAPGIKEFDPSIENGDVCIVHHNHSYITLAIAHEESSTIAEMVANGYGKVAKNLRNQRSSLSIEAILSAIKAQNWETVYRANSDHIASIVREATRFIQKTIAQHPNEKVAVGYSGGKDSLSTLLLVYAALGPNFMIFFADTGIELPETLENTYEVTKLLEMEDKLHIRYAKDKIWDLIEHFGPPGRDYRFCCHGLKAQRINEIISSVAPAQKVLSFLGQRRYESFSRAAEKRVYVNTFIPQQIAATPIKNWNALEVWLYILYHPHIVDGRLVKVPVNAMYFKEFERIGCFLCPASDIATLRILREYHPELMKKWDDWLERYAEKKQLPTNWTKFGLWRFRHLDKQWKDYFVKKGIDYSALGFGAPNLIQFNSDSEDRKITGKILLPIRIHQLKNLTEVFPGTILIQDDSLLLQNRQIEFHLTESGTFSLQSNTTRKNLEKFFNHILTIITKTDSCANCGVCEDICPQKIISIEKHGDKYIPVVGISVEAPCSHCLRCITHCPLYSVVKGHT
jgi:phosphoadenosine phosphosulfate reductase